MDIQVEVWQRSGEKYRSDMPKSITGLGKGWESLGSVYRMRKGIWEQKPENLQQIDKKLASKKEWSRKY